MTIPYCLTVAVARKVPSFIWAALVLRVIWLLAVDIDPVSDGFMYRDFATSIATGLGYAYPDGQLTAYWAVGASALYGLFKVLFGFSEWPIACVNLLMGVGIVYFTFKLALSYFDRMVATCAAWLVTVWPVLIQFTSVYASELVFIFFLLAALTAWNSKISNVALRSFLWGGLLCVATYVRPTAFPLFFVLPVLEYWTRRNLRVAFISGVIAAMTAGVLFAPWLLRNQHAFGVPVLVSANFGSNLWMGNNRYSNGGYMPLPEVTVSNEIERDQYFKNQAIDYIKSNPLSYLKLSIRRVIITYDRETIGAAWNELSLVKLVGERGLVYIKAISTLYWWLILLAAASGIGMMLFRKKSNIFHPLVVISGFFFMVPILTVGQDRYHMPLNPFLAMFAAIALDAAWKRFNSTRNSGTLPQRPKKV